jgi:hypothetical protein
MATPCSAQILSEALFLVNYTAKWDAAEARMVDLSKSIAEARAGVDQSWAAEQQPDGGYWGPCLRYWFGRVDATISGINLLQASGAGPKFRITFLENVTAPPDARGIIDYYESVLTTDIAGAVEPINHREELGAVTGAFHQLAFKGYLRDWLKTHDAGFTLDDAWVAAYTAFVDSPRFRDLGSGMWGERYVNGTSLVLAPDLSLTYHAVTYRKGHVPLLTETLHTVRVMRPHRYPYGWLTAFGHLVNHNTMDIAKIVRDGYKLGAVPAAEQMLWTGQFAEMLEFALSDPLSVAPGTHCFVFNPFYDSLGSAYYFGVAALAAIDYFSPAGSVFWNATASFPRNATVCCEITHCLEKSGAKDADSIAAAQVLQSVCPTCE